VQKGGGFDFKKGRRKAFCSTAFSIVEAPYSLCRIFAVQNKTIQKVLSHQEEEQLSDTDKQKIIAHVLSGKE
jgi:hypothetical protein